MKYPTRKNLIISAANLDVYYTQDRDGFVQMWNRRPRINRRLGIWEGLEDPIFSKDVPIFHRYSRCWQKSLITPETLKLATESNAEGYV